MNLTILMKHALAASALMAAAMGAGAQNVPLAEALDDAAWNRSQWISAADAPVVTGTVNDGTRAADGANWFAATLKNGGKVISARWMTTALGVYDLYVNGKPVGDEVLKPGFTHPYKTRRSFTYDITPLIDTRPGAENRLAAQVTPGWWADKIVTPGGHQGMVGRKCAFRGVLELTYADGTRQLAGTDVDNWKAGIAGPVKHAAIFDGEVYDARQPMGYDRAGALSTPQVNTEFKGEILPTDGAEIYLRRDLALQPVRAYLWQEVEGAGEEAYGKVVIKEEFPCGVPEAPMTLNPGETLVVDFGQNCAAVPEFRFQAGAGTRLRCVAAELLNDGNGAKSRGMDGPEGSVHRLNLRIPDRGMYLDYTFAGSDAPATYLPRCTFFGYRWLSITADAPVTIRSIRSIPVTSLGRQMETGTLATGNPLVNRLIANTLWGQRSNYLSVPTDCPQRNERLGWTADTQVFAETGTFFADTRRFFHKWMRDMRDSQHPLGGFPGVAPLGQYGNEMTRLGWSDAGVIVPWTVWKQFADVRIIEDNWEAMEKYLRHLDETCYDHNALKEENLNYQWADWLSYEPLESCSGRAFDENGPLPEALDYWNYLSASYWAIDAGMMRQMAGATGRDTARYARMEQKAKDYIREKFITPEGEFKTAILNTMQTPALFALKNNLLEGAAKERMKQRLRQNFGQHGNCLQTGFLGTSILMQTLTENGMADIAYELLFQRKNPSWLYSVDNGATTVWERWNSYMIESGMGPRGMNSFNHYAYGCVCEWLWETAAGIAADPGAPGFRHIVMRPLPDKRLGHLKASYRSASGLVVSEWHYEGNQWVWRFTIPQGTTASVTLPGETEARRYGPGSHSIRKEM